LLKTTKKIISENYRKYRKYREKCIFFSTALVEFLNSFGNLLRNIALVEFLNSFGTLLRNILKNTDRYRNITKQITKYLTILLLFFRIVKPILGQKS
jgi:hypothetical protein